MFCEECFGKYRRRYRSFSERVGSRFSLRLPNKQSLCSFSWDNKCALYELELQKNWQALCDHWLKKSNYRDLLLIPSSNKQVLFSFQCTSTNNRFTAIANGIIKNDTDNLHDDDTLTPADLMAFAWQIAKGMVRAGLRTYYRDWQICLKFVI